MKRLAETTELPHKKTSKNTPVWLETTSANETNGEHDTAALWSYAMLGIPMETPTLANVTPKVSPAAMGKPTLLATKASTDRVAWEVNQPSLLMKKEET